MAEQRQSLIDNVKDWQITHGSLLKLVRTDEEHTILSQPIGISLYPSLFPEKHFNHARSLQTLYNELYARVAQDEEWLFQVLKPFMREESLISVLWDIHERVKAKGYAQSLTLGIFRSDYMLHSTDRTQSTSELKQVEFNGIACAGMVHSNLASRMHQHLCRTGIYTEHPPLLSDESDKNPIKFPALPLNDNTRNIVSTLASAHSAYAASTPPSNLPRAILFIVQPSNINICDERPLEYALWDEGIPVYRLEFGSPVLQHTTLIPETGRLLYYPPSLFHEEERCPLEISCVYYRAGHEEQEYECGNEGVEARLRIERSIAIKCPSVLAQLATMKAVQVALSTPSALSRFFPSSSSMSSPSPITLLSQANMPQYTLSPTLPLLSDPRSLDNYILKPASLEGGGHNIYPPNVPSFLSSLPETLFSEYMIQGKITPPPQSNVLMGPRGIWEGGVEVELGIVGGCLWRVGVDKGRDDGDREGTGSVEFLLNENLGFTVKSKAVGTNEMSVVKGYGCFDSLCLA